MTHQTSAIGSLRRAIAVYEKALAEHDALRVAAGRSSRSSSTTRATSSRSCGTRAPAPSRPARRPTSRCCSRRGTTRSSPAHHHGSTRVGRLLGSAAHFLALEGIIVLYALIVLAPFLLLGGARLVDPARAAAARGTAARERVICWNTASCSARRLPVGHEIGLIVVAAIFIAFALVASFVVPRYKPDFPGPNGHEHVRHRVDRHVRADGRRRELLRLARRRVLCPHFGEVAEWLKAAPC